MRKIIPIIMILLVGSCTLFNQGPDPYNIAEWVEKPPIGTKLTFKYYLDDEEGDGWTREYTLSHIYEDDTIFTVYYTFSSDSNDEDWFDGVDTMFLTVNFRTNCIWNNGINPQIYGEHGEVVLRTPIEIGYEFDSNIDPFITYRIGNTDTVFHTQNDTLENIIILYDRTIINIYSLKYIVRVYRGSEYLTGYITELEDVH